MKMRGKAEDVLAGTDSWIIDYITDIFWWDIELTSMEGTDRACGTYDKISFTSGFGEIVAQTPFASVYKTLLSRS